LNEHQFLSLEDAQEKLEAWRGHYNEEQPHSSLEYQAPLTYQALIQEGKELVLQLCRPREADRVQKST
jgi:transposase InsO family protein